MILGRTVTTMVATAILVLTPGLAYGQGIASEQEGVVRGFEGEILANGTDILDSFGILNISILASGEEKSIKLDGVDGLPIYQLKVPGRFRVADPAQVLEPGAEVAVLARLVEGEWSAIQVLVKPESPTITPQVGVVIDTSQVEGTLRIMTPEGRIYTLGLPSDITAPSTGEFLVAFTKNSFDYKDLRSLDAPYSIRGIAKASELTQRLEAHLQEVSSAQGILADADAEIRSAEVEKLANLLEYHIVQRKSQLGTALENATERHKATINAAIDDTEIDGQRAIAAVSTAREKSGTTTNNEKSDGSYKADESDSKSGPDNDLQRDVEKDSTTDAVDDAVDDTTDAVDDATDATDAVDDTTDAVDGTVDDTSDAVDDAVDDTSDAVDDAVDDTSDAVDDAVDDTTSDPVDDAVDDTVDDVTDAVKDALGGLF